MSQSGKAERTHSGVSRGDEVRHSAGVRKRRRKRRDRFILYAVLLFVLAAIAVVAITLLFKVGSVHCENSAERYSDEQLLAVANITQGSSMFAINTSAAESRLEKNLPYIGKAEIKRKLPDVIVISVEYTSASLAVQNAGSYTLLDTNGKVLENGVAVLSDYVAEIYGATVTTCNVGENVSFAENGVLEQVTKIAGEFEQSGIDCITAYNFTNYNDVTVEIDYRIEVKLGTFSDAANKITFGKEVIKRTLQDTYQGKTVIDLTNEKTAYVRSQADIDAASEAASIALAQSESSTGVTVSPDEPSSEKEEDTSVTQEE